MSITKRMIIKVNGFTIIEIAIVLIFIVSISLITSSFFFKDYGSSLVDQTIDDINLIKHNALIYYAKSGYWPDQAGGCSDAVANFGTNSGLTVFNSIVLSPWYNNSGQIPYITNCTAMVSFSVSLTLYGNDVDWINQINNKLPLSTITGGTTVVAFIPAPSASAAKYNHLKRILDSDKEMGKISQNDMQADINLNGNRFYDYQVLNGINKSNAIFSLPMQKNILSDNAGVLKNLMVLPDGSGNFTIDICPDDSTCHSPNGIRIASPKDPIGSLKANDFFINSKNEYFSNYETDSKWTLMNSFTDMHKTKFSSVDDAGYTGHGKNKKPEECNPIHSEYGNYYKYRCSILKPSCQQGYSPELIIKPNLIRTDTEYTIGLIDYKSRVVFSECRQYPGNGYNSRNEWRLCISTRGQLYNTGLSWDDVSTVNVDTYCVKD